MKDKIWVGFDNYVTILTSKSFRDVTINTLIWTVFSTFFAFLLGLCAALALHREFAGRGVLRALLLIPYVVSAVAASYVWKWLYHSDFGVIGALSVQLGFTDRPINFLDNLYTALPSLIVVNIWKEFSFAMIMLMAGLQTVPDQLLRAAQVDGASAWHRFWHVTFPASERRVDGHRPAADGRQPQLVHHPLDHDRRRAGGRLGHLDHPDLQPSHSGVRATALASAYSVILFIIMMTLGYFYVRALTRGDESRAG